MKYISQIIVGVAFLITIVACSNVESKLQDYVNEENVNLPIEYSGELVLEKCEFDKNNVVYKYKLPEVAITPEEAEELKASFLNEDALADARFKQLLTLLAEGGYGLVYDYSDYKNNSISITFSPQEIKTIIEE
jgi:hypothetical protein